MIAIIGDLHGCPESLHLASVALGLADENLCWVAEKTILIITGDACDRGHDSASIYKLIMKWQYEAEVLGSKVIFIIGNHEIMNISGDLYYNTAEEIASYGGAEAKVQAFAPEGWLFEWLKNQAFIVKAGPFIVAHADFPDIYQKYSITEIEELSRDYFSNAADGISIMDPLLWCRSARENPEGYQEALTDFLDLNDARSWVCGHTPSVKGLMRRAFDGRYICVDTAMGQGIYNTSILVWDKEILRAVYFDGRGDSRIETISLPK